MSGDVQPRKRGKDKSKRRRAEDADAKVAEQLARKMSTLNADGEDEDAPKVSGVQAANMGPDDIQLHVQKDDHGTGGHWCAKIFFFSLMAILVGLVGLILLENRGISDLDTPLSESRFADYLDGWVEEKRESHDEHDILESLHELDDHDHDHDEPFAEEEDHDEDSESHDEEHEDDDDDHDEEEDGHDEDDDEPEQNAEDEVEGDSKASDENEDDEEDGGVDENESSEDKSPKAGVVKDVANGNEEEDDDDADDAGGDDENDSTPEQNAAEPNDDDDNADDDNDEDDDDKTPTTVSDELVDDNKSGEDDSKAADNDSDPFDEEDDDDASFEEVIDNDEGEDIHLQKLANDPAASADADGDDDQQDESSSVTVKVGVGLALVVVAYLVLARKAQPNDAADDEEETLTKEHQEPLSAAYSRRMTLVNKDEPLPDGVGEEEGLKRYKEQSTDSLEEELRRANEQLAENLETALKRFDTTLATNGSDPVALYGRAKALDALAAQRKDNRLLRQSIAACERLIMQLGIHLSDHVFRATAERCVEQMRFIGLTLRSVTVHNKLIERFPDDPQVHNQLAVSYLMANKLDDAKIVLHNTLLRWRTDGVALVHYGFVLKNLDNDLPGAVQFLSEGIRTKENGTSDGRFFFALGDSLQRLGRVDEARHVYRLGTKLKLFRSEYQRSLYNVDRLQSQPFWHKADTGVAAQLDALATNWRRIRDEGLAVLGEDGYFFDESENLRDKGFWKQFDLFSRGQRVAGHCDKTPFTCKLIETFPAARHCTRGQVKFSVMHPGTHVWPHCGPTNCRLRAHLGLHVPSGTFLRVADETRSWREGELLIFDDSYEHEVWHNGTSVRLVLIVDIWHPELTVHERETLPPI